MAAPLGFVKKVAPKSMDVMAIAEVRPFGSMPELARITQAPHYGAYPRACNQILSRLLKSVHGRSAVAVKFIPGIGEFQLPVDRCMSRAPSCSSNS